MVAESSFPVLLYDPAADRAEILADVSEAAKRLGADGWEVVRAIDTGEELRGVFLDWPAPSQLADAEAVGAEGSVMGAVDNRGRRRPVWSPDMPGHPGFDSVAEAAEATGCNPPNITQAIKRDWLCGGRRWREGRPPPAGEVGGEAPG